MAILAKGTIFAGVVQGGALITVPANGNALRMQMANTNRSKGTPGQNAILRAKEGLRPKQPSKTAPQAKTKQAASTKGTKGKRGVAGSPFTMLDSTIVELDNTYDLLPDKTPWVTYATKIAGEWSLCANCQPDSGAKKLFRQYNFNRQLIGLPVASAPVDDTEVCDAIVSNGNWYPNALPTAMSVIDAFSSKPSFYVVATIGQALANPFIIFLTADSGVVQPVPNLYSAWLQEVMTALGIFGSATSTVGNAAVCVFTASGAPGIRNTCYFAWDP
jgi:hypothetical protein